MYKEKNVDENLEYKATNNLKKKKINKMTKYLNVF